VIRPDLAESSPNLRANCVRRYGLPCHWPFEGRHAGVSAAALSVSIGVCGYLFVLVGLYAFQRHLLYQPDRTVVPPAELGLADAAVEHI
jgi:hypothetical protein